MAEEQIKKKRGRPPKKQKEETMNNENVERIVMTQGNVGKNNTMTDVQRQLQSVFSKYSKKDLTYSDYLHALGNSFLNNPFVQNERIKRINAPIHGSDKQTINNALEAPQNNEDLLRQESQALYWQSYVYNNLVKINREVPMCFNYVIPCNVDEKTCKTEKWKKEWKFVNNFVKAFDLRRVCKDIAIDVALEGKRSYVFRASYDKETADVDFCVFQKLPTQWVKYTKIGNETPYVTSLNFMMFLEEGQSVEFYSPFIRQVWDKLIRQGIITVSEDGKIKKFNPNVAAKSGNNYILEYTNNSYLYWVELPQNEVYEFGADNSNPLQVPDYVGLFTDFRSIDDYKWLQNQLLSKSINSVLVGTVPLIDNVTNAGGDEVAISMDSIIGFSDMFTSAVSSNILPFFAPFEDFDLLSLPLPPDAKEIVNTSLKNTINSTGIGALISTTDKPSIISVKTAQQLAEAKAEYLNLQIQNCVNTIINKTLGLEYKYQVSIWGGKFTYKDDLSFYKELLLSGVSSVLPRILSSFDQSIDDCDSINSYLKSINLYDKFVPFTTLSNNETTKDMEEEVTTKKVGRKSLGDEVENDNTAISIEQGNNVSDIKEFSTKCHKCGKLLTEDEDILCDECLANICESRL